MTKKPIKFITAYVQSLDRITERMLREYCHPEIVEAYSLMNAKLIRCLMENSGRMSLSQFIAINRSLNDSESQLFINAMETVEKLKIVW